MKKRFIKLLSLLSVLFLMAGCGNQNDADTTNEAKKEESTNEEITFMVPDWGVPTDQMLDDFKEETGITVNVQATSWDDIRDKVATAAAGKKVAADVFEVDWSWVGEFNAAGWLMPLEVSDEDAEDIPTLESFSIDGKAYAMPYSNDYRIAYYNKEMFDKVGASEAKTWDEVIETSKKLKDEGVCEYPIAFPLKAEESTTTSLMWLAYSRNNVFFNDDNTINKDALYDGLEVIDQIVKDGLVDPANAESNGQVAYAKILNEEAAFMIGPSSYVTRINNPDESEVVDKIVPTLLPGIDKEATVTVPFAEAIGISSYTENSEAAKKWVEWYTSKQNQLALFKDVSVLPTRNSVLNDLIEDGSIKDSGSMLELAEIIESPFPNGVPKYYTKMSTEIFNTVNQMTSDKITLDQAADDIEKNVNNIVEENK